MNSTRYHLNLQIVHTICLNKYGVISNATWHISTFIPPRCGGLLLNKRKYYSYTVTLITSAKTRRILLIPKVRSVRSSETIFRMNVFASFQLAKLSGEKQDHFTFSPHSLCFIINDSVFKFFPTVNTKLPVVALLFTRLLTLY